MENQTYTVAAVALVVGVCGGYFVANQQCQPAADQTPTGMHRMPDGSLMGAVDKAPMKANQMDHMKAMFVESERDFINGMIPHHQEAVDTAKEVIARGGTTPEVASLVQEIVEAQEGEIATMKQWYRNWYGVPYANNDAYVPMMRDLEGLSGSDIDAAFLEDMIDHHMGAIMMAQSVQPYIEHDDIAELTQAIVSSQSAEISQMRQMLKSL